MSAKGKKFTDDGWAIWIDGDDVCTVYFQDWMTPKGKSYIDISVDIVGIKCTGNLHLYIPFEIEKDEIEDISLLFKNVDITRAVFSGGCIFEYMKNEYTSEIAYNGKTMDIIHISKLDMHLEKKVGATLLSVEYKKIQPFIDNDEGYFLFRIPHKSLDRVFKTYSSADSFLMRAREVITTPILSEKYGYSIRVNEARAIPYEIYNLGAFHKQKLRKVLVSVSISEDYEINDINCYQIFRLEENLYRNFVPDGFNADNVITYQWKEEKDEKKMRGKFNFYLNITRNAVSPLSMVVYMFLIIALGAVGEFFAEFTKWLIFLILR